MTSFYSMTSVFTECIKIFKNVYFSTKDTEIILQRTKNEEMNIYFTKLYLFLIIITLYHRIDGIRAIVG